MYEGQDKTRDGNTRKSYNSSGKDINVALIRKAASGMRKIARFWRYLGNGVIELGK